MRKFYLFSIVCILIVLGCTTEQDKWLDQEPTDILTDEQVWKNPDRVYEVLANLYQRIPDYQNLDDFANFADFDNAFPSSYGDYFRVQNVNFSYDAWNYWDYAYVREINLFIQKAKKADQLDNDKRKRFLAEAHFLRANVYFELVKRMGGVPILKDTLQYNYSGDPSYLQHKRDKEYEVYDFVIKELDSAKNNLPRDAQLKSRATWGAALAMKTRAALYAGSIANYGVQTPNVTLPGDIVGIPKEKQDHYYTIALNSAEKLINESDYELYRKYPNDLEKNFAELFLDKGNNPEVIFIKDYKLKSLTTQFTVQNQPHSMTEEGDWSGVLNPSLNLAQSFEKLDNTFSPFKNKDASGNYITYDKIGDIFKNRDARLGGTIILPGSQFREKKLDIFAGYQLSDGDIISGSQFGEKKTLPGESGQTQVIGFDGPTDQREHGTQTGFYIRKYLDPAPGHGEIGTGSDVRWIRYRYAEVLLNAAEAAYELGEKDKAANYMNEVRSRAGFSEPLSASDIDFDRIVHERKVEFAFEGLRFWDLKRWRLAHKVWNGETRQLTVHPEKADGASTRQWGLWPYKIYDPGNPDDGKWIFKEVIPDAVLAPKNFRLGNYYSAINEGTRSNNPKLRQNPNQ